MDARIIRVFPREAYRRWDCIIFVGIIVVLFSLSFLVGIILGRIPRMSSTKVEKADQVSEGERMLSL